MNPTNPDGTSPGFQALLDRSDEVFSAIKELMSDPERRDLEKLRRLNDEASQIADQMERALMQKRVPNQVMREPADPVPEQLCS